MSKVLVSVLSDYLQPNFLLIKEMEGMYDELVFVTTIDMETDRKKKSYWLEKALSLDRPVKRVLVEEDNCNHIISTFEQYSFSADNSYIVNLTGGTKVMSIAVHNYFSQFDTIFYYVPIGKNVICNINKEEVISLKYRMNLREYFTLYGLTYSCDNKLTYQAEFTKDLFERFKNANFNRYRVADIVNAQSLSNATDRRYYGGEWFEEYSFVRLKKEMNLQDDQICKNAKIYRANSLENDNEIDVMFVRDNLLYIFECKVTMKGNPMQTSSQAIEGFLYKLAAISKDFGLRVNSYLLTLHNVKNNMREFNEKRLEMLDKRREILGIRNILDSSDFKQQKLNM